MYNDSYMAEKAWDNLYDRNEDAEVKDCGTCQGSGRDFYSDCCGAEVQFGVCKDCHLKCEVESEPCLVCKGEGTL